MKFSRKKPHKAENFRRIVHKLVKNNLMTAKGCKCTKILVRENKKVKIELILSKLIIGSKWPSYNKPWLL